MLPFSLAFLSVFVLRAEMPDVGRLVAGASLIAITLRLWRKPRPGLRLSTERAWAAVVGAALAAVLPAAAEPPSPPPPPLEACGQVAHVEGTVEPGGRVDGRGAFFRLRAGPAVRVSGATASPPPHSVVAVLGRLDPAGGLVTVAAPDAITLVREAPFWSPAGFFDGLRRLCRERIRQSCPEGTARVLLPLLIGDAGLPEDLRDDLARTGSLHVIAVSGTHLSLFLAGLRLFTRRLRFLVPMLVVYAGMCAFEPPVLRSLVLAIGFLCGRRLGRALPQGPHFLLSAVVVLACDPAAFFDAGFQLSFSAFGGMLAFGARPRVRDPFEEARAAGAWRRLAAFLAPATRAGLGATLATAPAMAWRFHRISPIGVPATLLLSPFIPALLWLGALIVLFPSVPAFPKLATALIDLLALVASLASALPFASVDVARPHPWALAAFSAVVLSIALAGDGPWSRVRVASLALASVAVLVPDRVPPGLYQLAAGRGAATLLVGRDAAVLVDAGPANARVAEQVLELGIASLDLVLVTHGHEDHAGGLAQVIARNRARRVVAGPSGAGPGAPRAETWTAGDRFEKGDLTLRALWPPAGFRGADNDRSLVLFASAGGLRCLLAGDIESDGLRALLRAEPLEPADVVLAPHHGSENAGLCDLLLRTQPHTVIISARPGFPAEETLRLLERMPVEIRSTWREGVIKLHAWKTQLPTNVCR
jgi:competence protein ComEC